ncbi:glutamate--tRNA ligase, partial [Candidatus Berkelbacteria bacterium CG11_big_fil_rev_8_21_14_0_20_42_15]
MIKTRFAPSPTGELHIGSARTALFNYLFAKHNKGEFLLRIEDTDKERSSKKYEKNILDGLEWLGIAWNGKILYQSSRLNEYKSVADKLVKDGFAVEENGAIILKAKATLDKLGIKYEEAKKISTDAKNKNSDQKAYLLKNIGEDLIHGKISGVVCDAVLLRSSGTPTFHLAVVVDDEFMKITHVIRGDDHLSNTPLHIVLQKALGYKIPKYAHIPMILGPDRAKLSKRHAATSVLEYRKLGYLPEAIVNFIALLGWNPKDEREIFSLPELVREFDLKNVNKAGAIFDIGKLNHFNMEYLKLKIQNAKVKTETKNLQLL